MKILITTIIATCLSTGALASNGDEGIKPAKRLLEKWQKNFVLYPKESLKEKKNGIVFVSFELSANGQMKNLKVEEGISQDLDQKAIEIAGKMPTDHLIQEEGKMYILPVKFSIQ